MGYAATANNIAESRTNKLSTRLPCGYAASREIPWFWTGRSLRVGPQDTADVPLAVEHVVIVVRPFATRAGFEARLRVSMFTISTPRLRYPRHVSPCGLGCRNGKDMERPPGANIPLV